MPYLQLDLPAHYPLTARRDLARRMSDPYAGIMQTAPDLADVCFRELGEGGLWHCATGEPTAATVLSCEIRRGQPPEQRARLAGALIDACPEARGLNPTRLAVEFLQRARDETFRKARVNGVLRGRLGRDWSAVGTMARLMDASQADAETGP